MEFYQQYPSADGNWLVRIRTDHENALRELYRLYRTECVDWLMKTYSVSEALAKDAFQLAIVLLYQNVITYKVDVLSSSIKSYLFAIAKNKVRDLIKSEVKHAANRKRAILREEFIDDNDSEQVYEVILEKVRHLMFNMGDPCKSILELYYFQRLKLKDIAEVVGHNEVNTTKSKKHKCLRKLHKIITKSNIFPFEA